MRNMMFFTLDVYLSCADHSVAFSDWMGDDSMHRYLFQPSVLQKIRIEQQHDYESSWGWGNRNTRANIFTVQSTSYSCHRASTTRLWPRVNRRGRRSARPELVWRIDRDRTHRPPLSSSSGCDLVFVEHSQADVRALPFRIAVRLYHWRCNFPVDCRLNDWSDSIVSDMLDLKASRCQTINGQKRLTIDGIRCSREARRRRQVNFQTVRAEGVLAVENFGIVQDLQTDWTLKNIVQTRGCGHGHVNLDYFRLDLKTNSRTTLIWQKKLILRGFIGFRLSPTEKAFIEFSQFLTRIFKQRGEILSSTRWVFKDESSHSIERTRRRFAGNGVDFGEAVGLTHRWRGRELGAIAGFRFH